MARFYNSANGKAHTQATREGTAYSGIHSHTRGWHVGVMVDGRADDSEATRREPGRDVFSVKVTTGSAGYGYQFLGTVSRKADGTEPITFEPSAELCRALGIKYRPGRQVVIKAD